MIVLYIITIDGELVLNDVRLMMAFCETVTSDLFLFRLWLCYLCTCFSSATA